MWFGVITLLPQMFTALHYGILGRALARGLLTVECWNPRDFAHDKRKTVDGKPYGGGVGMLMMAQPLHDAVMAAKRHAALAPLVVHLSPQGRQFKQCHAYDLLRQQSVILVAGRYEGIDERFIQTTVDLEYSVGDYILSGGEFAAMIVIDVVSRLVTGALNQTAVVNDSFGDAGLLKYPQYTKPLHFAGLSVPEVLLSGNHQEIDAWRKQQSLSVTYHKRPDLLSAHSISAGELQLLSKESSSKVDEKVDENE